jgi:uncharacterized protein (DUF1330 family)
VCAPDRDRRVKPGDDNREGGTAVGEEAMSAYLIVQQTVTDPARLEEYRAQVGPILAKYGARFVTKAGSHKLLVSGGRPPGRVAIVEFPDMATLDAWYGSPEYQPLIALRRSAVDAETESLIAVDGA